MPALAEDRAAIVDVTRKNPWYLSAEKALSAKPAFADSYHKARNIILFVGDGMGVSTLTAARILAGQQLGMSGEEHRLSFEHFPYSGLSKTYNVDAQTPDSAGTMTAMASGVKTRMGFLGIDENARRGDCNSSRGRELFSSLELAELAGMATGVISTVRITHATPAALYAKAPERDWESDGDVPPSTSGGCKDIALQLIEFQTRIRQRFPGTQSDGIDVIMGGGRRAFLPESDGGKRQDGRNLLREWQAAQPAGHLVSDYTGFQALSADQREPIFALFSPSHMRYEMDRRRVGDQPSLAEMTTLAVKKFQQQKKAYLLVVEAGRIDHAHHAGNAFNALHDTIALSDAVKAAAQLTDQSDTLIIVTADHSHVFTMAGYPRRGNPILGKVVAVGEVQPSLAADGKPYTTLGYINGRGFRDRGHHTDADGGYSGEINAGRQSLSGIDTTKAGFHQEALVPLESETHGGEDVAIFARGPGAALVSGSNEQHLIFHIINHAAGLTARAGLDAP